MSTPWAHDRYLEYAAVFPQIAALLNASGLGAQVNDNADRTGLLVVLTFPDGTTAVLGEGEGDNWSINIGGKAIRLDIPVESRDAKAIAAAVRRILGN